MHAVHSPIAGPADGLANAVGNQLSCLGLDRDRVVARCARYVEEHPLPDDTDDDAASLAELIIPGAGDDGVRLATPADRYRIIRRLLERMCARRPVILWIDDVQWGADALGFTEFALASDRAARLPLLIVLTVRDPISPTRSEGAQLDALLSRSAAGRLEVAALPPDDHAHLVELLLGLSGDLAADVAARTQGNPLFAVQLIGDWVTRGVLSVDDSGFILKRGASADIPDDIHQLWSDRIDTILSELAETDRRNAGEALEIAAALGQRVVADEWFTACSLADVPVPGDLVELMLAQRLAVPFDGDWSFAHGMLRESLERRARDDGRWPKHHGACAAMLTDRYSSNDPGIANRLGRHLYLAGDLAAAIGPLFTGAEQRRHAADFRRAHALYDELERCMTDLALPADDARWGQLWTRRARACVSQGRLDQAEALTATAASRAGICQWPAVAAWAANLQGHITFSRGDPAPSRERFESAVELFRATDDTRGLADALTGLGRASMWQRVLAPANAAYQEAYELHKRSGDMYELGMVLRGLAGLRHCENELTEARALLQRASSCFEHSGNRLEIANCMNDLGEIARAGGDLEEAEALYRRAGELYESLGCSDASTPHFNLGLVLLESGNYREARERFDQERELLGAEQKSIDMLWLNAGLMTCAAADAQWLEYDDLLDQVEHLLKGFVDEDIAWCTSRAGTLAAKAGQASRAHAAWRVARAQWTLLDRSDKIAELDDALEMLDSR
jgi:tetratricopeptide (TPR) repeat protein